MILKFKEIKHHEIYIRLPSGNQSNLILNHLTQFLLLKLKYYKKLIFAAMILEDKKHSQIIIYDKNPRFWWI